MDPAATLRKQGYQVVQFSEYHFRIEGVFDFWLSRRGCKWWYQTTGERGHRPPDQIPYLVGHLLGAPLPPGTTTEKEFIGTLVRIGWPVEEARKEWNARKSPVE